MLNRGLFTKANATLSGGSGSVVVRNLGENVQQTLELVLGVLGCAQARGPECFLWQAHKKNLCHLSYRAPKPL